MTPPAGGVPDGGPPAEGAPAEGAPAEGAPEAGTVRRGRGRPRSRRADEAIIAATFELLERHGVSGLSIEAVAQRAGVAKTTIYRRWPSKEELVLDVLAAARGPVPGPPAGRSVRQDLVDLLTAAASNHRDVRQGTLIMRRLVAEMEDYPELAQGYLNRVIGPRRERLLGILRRGVEEGTIRRDVDLNLAAEALIAPVLLGAWVPFGPRARQSQMPALVDLVLDGLSPRS